MLFYRTGPVPVETDLTPASTKKKMKRNYPCSESRKRRALHFFECSASAHTTSGVMAALDIKGAAQNPQTWYASSAPALRALSPWQQKKKTGSPHRHERRGHHPLPPRRQRLESLNKTKCTGPNLKPIDGRFLLADRAPLQGPCPSRNRQLPLGGK